MKKDSLGDQMCATEEIELTISDENLLFLALEAHKKDITLNEYINQILKKYVDELNYENN